MNICLAFSKSWVEYVYVELYSLFKNNIINVNINNPNNNKIKVYLLSEDLDEKNLNQFNRICNYFGSDKCVCEYIDISNVFDELITSNINVSSRFSKYTLVRLAIPQLINDDKLLYIDSDAIVIGDIYDFYNTDFDNNLLIGVVDSGINNDYKKRYEININSNYINAGICLMNLKKIKQMNLGDMWIQMVNNVFYPNHDQDIWNISCQNKIGTTNIEYNTSLSTGLNINESNIKIMHYAGIKSVGKDWVKNLYFSQIWDKIQKEYDEIMKYRIPKVIYTCWFGDGEKPQLVKECMESWVKIMPDYKIVEINEHNFDINAHQYAKNAYEQKKWAFLTDYVRLKVLYDNGGIYMDSDVKVLKPLDKFLENRAFTGHEADCWLLAATMGSEQHHPWIKMLLNYYDIAELDDIPNTQIVTKLSESWIESRTKDYTYLKEDVVIYPTNFFTPYDHKALKPIIKNDSYTCHLFLGSWIGRTKVNQKKYDIDFSQIMDVAMNWQMSLSERSSIYYILNKMKNHNIAIEVGSFQGGLTFVLDKYFKKVYSLDINHSLIFNKSQYKNTDWITGDSKQTLPILIDKLNKNNEDVNFILIDANHEYDYVYSDLSNLLKYKPKNDLIILIHDSWYLGSRRAICAIPWKNNPYVHYVNTDYCKGELIYQNNKNVFIGGLCLIIMSQNVREIPLVIEQPHDFTYCKINQILENPI